LIRKKGNLFSVSLGKTRRRLRRRRGRRETNHHFFRNSPQGQLVLREPRMAEVGGKSQGIHLWNVGVVKEIIGIEIVLTERKK
jgi:hypothetical protein